MPGAADNGKAFAVFGGGADGFAHPCFALVVAGAGCFRQGVAQGGNGFGNGGKEVFAVTALFDGGFPPFFAVAVAGDVGEVVKGMTSGGGGVVVVVFVVGEGVGQRQVAEGQWDVMRDGVLHGLPFG